MINSLSVFVLLFITVTEVGKILAKNLGKNVFCFFNSNNNETLNVCDFYMYFKEINFSLFHWEILMKY
jgi:type I restriction-modification system DNA methylase subunit